LVPDEYDQVFRLSRFRQDHPAGSTIATASMNAASAAAFSLGWTPAGERTQCKVIGRTKMEVGLNARPPARPGRRNDDTADRVS